MKTSLIRKTFENAYGNISIECESQNTVEDAILLTCMNDSIVIEYSTIPDIIKHLRRLLEEIEIDT
jgi:hypothetical protein